MCSVVTILYKHIFASLSPFHAKTPHYHCNEGSPLLVHTEPSISYSIPAMRSKKRHDGTHRDIDICVIPQCIFPSLYWLI